MSFPRRLRFNDRGKPLATIYRRPDGVFRLYWRQRRAVDGKPSSHMRDFRTYTEAKREGDKIVKDLAKAKAVPLTPGQVTEAVTAFKTLHNFYVETGRRLDLTESVARYCEAARRLGDKPLGEALDGYFSTVAGVKRVDLLKAAQDWIASRQPKTVATDGKRPELSTGYHYNVSMWVTEFATTFPGHAVCDLSKEHLDRYFAAHAGTPRATNERRMVVGMFLRWCASKDYLPGTHRLLEADGMKRVNVQPQEVELYTAEELRAMLERASKRPAPAKKGKEPDTDYRKLVPLISLVSLGGVRLAEAARLTWADVWHVKRHIEITATKSKTRARRLCTMHPSLARWLDPYRDKTGPLWPNCLDHWHREFEAMLDELEIPVRRNGLRHSFISYHYAVHTNEGLTANEAGNSPGVVHSNYKKLVTKRQGKAWFAVAPARPKNVIAIHAAAKR